MATRLIQTVVAKNATIPSFIQTVTYERKINICRVVKKWPSIKIFRYPNFQESAKLLAHYVVR